MAPFDAGADLRRCSIEQLTNRAARRPGDRARAGVSMGFSEALSDPGEQTGRGSGLIRGAITGAATTLGGLFHSLPFLIGMSTARLIVASIVVAIELFTIAYVRHRFLHVSLRSSLVVVTLGGAIVLAIGVAIGIA